MADENKRFGIHKKYGVDIMAKAKPTRGKLVQLLGSKELVLYENEPFAFLNSMKQKLIQENFIPSSQLKIKY